MKKFVSIFLALALALSLSVPTFAEGDTVGPGDKVEVKFTYAVVEPKYMVEIPATVELKLDEVVNLPVTLGISNPEVLDGRKIAITLEDVLTGQPPIGGINSDWFIVQNIGVPYGYYSTLSYAIIAGGYRWHHITDHSGRNLLEFTDTGVKDIGFLLEAISGWSYDLKLIYPNSLYKGWIVFGVKIVD